MHKRIIAAGIAAAAALGLAAGPATAGGNKPNPDHKRWVCKYVGKPGVDERLKGGKNPISVDSNATVGSYFKDGQGRSYVLAVDNGGPAPDVSACPAPDVPTDEPTTPTPDPTTTTPEPDPTTTTPDPDPTTTSPEPDPTTTTPDPDPTTTTPEPTTTTPDPDPTTTTPEPTGTGTDEDTSPDLPTGSPTTGSGVVVPDEDTTLRVTPASAAPAELAHTGAATWFAVAIALGLLIAGALVTYSRTRIEHRITVE